MRAFVRPAPLSPGFVIAVIAIAAAACAHAPSLDESSSSSTGSGGTASTGGAGGLGIDGPGPSSSSCKAAAELRTSVGCDYYAVDADGMFAADNGCFVAFVANTSSERATLKVSYDGTAIDLATHAKIPNGSGPSLTYAAFEPDAGLAAGEVAILFLAGKESTEPVDGSTTMQSVQCPVSAAVQSGAQVHGTGIGKAFHIETDVPVVAYQMLPYGGGAAAVTGSTLLLPTTAWAKNYVAVNAWSNTTEDFGVGPSMNIVASENGTEVTILPKKEIGEGPGVSGSPANVAVTYALNAGQVLQITQGGELTGSPVASTKPIGLWAGHQCSNVGAPYCDHMEQQIPAVRALGSEYVSVPYRQRGSKPESPRWRIVGVVDGTVLQYEPPVGGPTSLELGTLGEFATDTPFVVRSQDAQHPFLIMGYMTGAQNQIVPPGIENGYGDPEVVRMVPPAQYLSRYVFFTDPTYPETNLVVVRKKGKSGFADVELDCAGKLTGWKSVGADGQFEYTRHDLVRHKFQAQGACNTGRREMKSDQPFGLWVWGWGTSETQTNPPNYGDCVEYLPDYTCYVSYGYPAGEGLATINDVEVPVPK